MDFGWSAVLQAVILTFCTWYLRRGSRADVEVVTRRVARQSTSTDILTRVQAIEADLALVKAAALRDTSIDHRGPRRS